MVTESSIFDKLFRVAKVLASKSGTMTRFLMRLKVTIGTIMEVDVATKNKALPST